MSMTEIRPGNPVTAEIIRPGYVKKVIPFGLEALIEPLTHGEMNADPLQIKAKSHARDSAWIGWQMNRKARNMEQSGFEPYFLGSNLLPSEIGERLNQVGQSILFPLSKNQRDQVIRTIGDGTPSLDALIYLYGQFGATLAGFRGAMARRPEAVRYRNETNILCQNLRVQYPDDATDVRIHPLPQRIQLPPEVCRPALADTTGYDLMSRIGKVGDPLLWKALEVPSDAEIAARYNCFAFRR